MGLSTEKTPPPTDNAEVFHILGVRGYTPLQTISALLMGGGGCNINKFHEIHALVP